MTDIFNLPEHSHQHSLKTLELISAYDDFMDNLNVICDMGCGHGLDILWWANATYVDDQDAVQRRNYKCFGVDLDISKIPSDKPRNLHLVDQDFETPSVSVKIDLLWSHDSF